jgi:VanZ family protein
VKNISYADFLRTWLPTVLFILLIMVLSFQPLPRLPRISQVDKYLHLGVYGLLAVLSARSFSRTGMRHAFVMAFLLTVAVGFADEGIQSLGTVRTADRYDLLADAGGGIIALLLVQVFRRRGSAHSSEQE